MKKVFLMAIMAMAVMLGMNSCVQETNLLEFRCGIMDDGEPTPGNMNYYYLAVPEAFDAVETAVKEVAGSKFIMLSSAHVPGQNLGVNGEDKMDVKSDVKLVVKKAKPAIEAAELNPLFVERTFCIQYRFGMETKDWTTAYTYEFPGGLDKK